MRIIDEIRQQRVLLGRGCAKHVLLSAPAFEQLLAEKDELSLPQVDTETIPPTVYGMSIMLADEHGPEVSVLPSVSPRHLRAPSV